MIRFLKRPDESGYIFAVSQSERLIQEINQELKHRLRKAALRLADAQQIADSLNDDRLRGMIEAS